jgi:hypothetical protein
MWLSPLILPILKYDDWEPDHSDFIFELDIFKPGLWPFTKDKERAHIIIIVFY